MNNLDAEGRSSKAKKKVISLKPFQKEENNNHNSLVKTMKKPGKKGFSIKS